MARARERFEERMERGSQRFQDRMAERHDHKHDWSWHEEWRGGSGDELCSCGSCSCGCCGGHGRHGGHGMGLIWPLLSSLLGILALYLFATLFDFLGYKNGGASSFFSSVAAFIFANLALFFGLMLLFGYAKWLTRRFIVLRPFKPLVRAARATISLWILALLFVSTGLYATNSFFAWLTLFIQTQLLALFFLFLIIAYIGFLIRMRMHDRWHAEGYAYGAGDYGECCPECGGRHFRERKEGKHAVVTRARAYKEAKWGGGRYKRLYRSDENRLLGGVCGGIAEYLDVDPVIVRLIWVVAALAWGIGVLAYIIAWIIIPRRPRR